MGSTGDSIVKLREGVHRGEPGGSLWVPLGVPLGVPREVLMETLLALLKMYFLILGTVKLKKTALGKPKIHQ